MKKCCIYYNDKKEIVTEFYKKLIVYLQEKKIEIFLTSEIKKVDFAIIIGGDGTFLRAAKQIIENPQIDVLAINGGSLGFLTEIRLEDAFAVIDDYLNGNYKAKKKGLLAIEVKGETYDALNEVVISKGGVMTNLLKISAYDNGEYINTYRADGLILATPTGSTAYSLSAGGPIISSDLEVIALTPIAPHNLSTRPIIISGKDNMTFKIEDEDRIGYLILDGDKCIEINNQDIVSVRYGGKSIKIIVPKKAGYYSILREKLKWGEKLC